MGRSTAASPAAGTSSQRKKKGEAVAAANAGVAAAGAAPASSPTKSSNTYKFVASAIAGASAVALYLGLIRQEVRGEGSSCYAAEGPSQTTSCDRFPASATKKIQLPSCKAVPPRPILSTSKKVALGVLAGMIFIMTRLS